MGCRILHNSSQATLYCSTTDWAFGPVFYDSDEHDAEERAELFCEWCNGKYGDPRKFMSGDLETKYSEFLRIESDLWKAKKDETETDDWGV